MKKKYVQKNIRVKLDLSQPEAEGMLTVLRKQLEDEKAAKDLLGNKQGVNGVLKAADKLEIALQGARAKERGGL